MGGKKEILDTRFNTYLEDGTEMKMIPRTSDGQLLFLLNNVAKMKKDSPLGSRIAEVHNGSSIFTGDAGSGESNARRYMIENDLVEAIIALPENMFYNTGIGTFIWVLSNKKEERRKGKIQLIDATDMKSPLRKNMGKKNCEFTPDIRKEIIRIFLDMEESEVSMILDNNDFAYWNVTVENGAQRDKLDYILDVCTNIYKTLEIEEQIEFKCSAKAFCRTYGFLGAILPYGNPEWEKLSIFLNLLIPKLPSPQDDDLSQGILETIDLDSYRTEARETMSIQLDDADSEMAPVPAGKSGHIVSPEMDLLSIIVSEFNDMFGNIDWKEPDNARRQILEIPAMVSKDEKYRNAMRNSDEQSAKLESERALQQVIFSIMADNMEILWKLYLREMQSLINTMILSRKKNTL